MTGGRGWVTAIAVVVVLCASGAVVLTLVASELVARAEAYFAQFDFASGFPGEIDEVEFKIYNDLYVTASNLMSVANPLLFCTFGAVAVLLAVLAHRFDERGSRARTRQAEATAAS